MKVETSDTNQPFDLFIIGGGINGAGIARDAAGRGLKVMLCEKDDFASATSSASTKLIHGGLRYLEYYEFGLVRKALKERETLLKIAPHIIWPLRFVLPHDKAQRPVWMLRLGLFLYDHLGGREILPPSKALNLSQGDQGAPLNEKFTRGFEYSDCWVDDARLVILNLMDASNKGANILSHTEFVGATRVEDVWRVRVRSNDGFERTVAARALVNAAGPWVARVLSDITRATRENRSSLRLVKGSHVIVKKHFTGEHAYIFQNPDGRIQFAIPYEADYTLIGTTDLPYEGDLENVEAEAEEKAYLIEAASEYFQTPISEDDIVHSYSGVRPLFDDSEGKSASAVTRDYVFEAEGQADEPPLLSVYGGKITTYRVLAEEAMRELEPWVRGSGGPWTESEPLPGGEIPGADFDAFLVEFKLRHPWLDAFTARRLARLYGTRAVEVVGDASDKSGLGEDFGHGLSEAEVRYLIDHEWARNADDVLWRRTKLGLKLSLPQKEELEAWMADARSRRTTPRPVSAG